MSASDAQKVVDIAVAAGATNVEGVDWEVRDRQALEAQVYGAAIARAKTIAEQTATQAGVKLGKIASIVNFANPFGVGAGAAPACPRHQPAISAWPKFWLASH